jgi:hypothetical protein
MPYYLKNLDEEGRETSVYDAPRERDDLGIKARITNVAVLNEQEEPTDMLAAGEPFGIELTFKFLETLDAVSVAIGIDTFLGAHLTTVVSESNDLYLSGTAGDTAVIRARFDNLTLNTGRFAVRASLRQAKTYSLDWVRQVGYFSVSDVRHERTKHIVPLVGLIQTQTDWKVVEPLVTPVHTS